MSQPNSLTTDQIQKLTGYTVKGKTLDLTTNTTYYSQRDNHVMPYRTCNSSSNAMYLDWLRRATGRAALGGDDAYLDKVLTYGDSPDHNAQTAALLAYGFNTKWLESGKVNDLSELLHVGIPVVVNILHHGTVEAPYGGHVIMLCGYNGENAEFLCQDPYGTLRSNYQDANGRLSRISVSEFSSRWQEGWRILT
jgi:Peptidase_C39 like family